MAREEWGEWRWPRRRAPGGGYGGDLDRWGRPPRWEEGSSRWGWAPWRREERRRLREGRRRPWEGEEPWAPEPEYEERWIPEGGYDYPYAGGRAYRRYREEYGYGWPYRERRRSARYGGEFAAGHDEPYYGGWWRGRRRRGSYGAEYGW